MWHRVHSWEHFEEPRNGRKLLANAEENQNKYVIFKDKKKSLTVITIDDVTLQGHFEIFLLLNNNYYKVCNTAVIF